MIDKIKKTAVYSGERTVTALLTFICHDFLAEETTISPFRLKCSKDLADACLSTDEDSMTRNQRNMLWLDKGPGILETLPANTVAYLEEEV